MDVKAIIIITSPYVVQNRFIPGEEWERAWGFDGKCSFAWRSKPGTVACCNKIDKISIEFPIIIWVNSNKINRNPSRLLQNLQKQLNSIKSKLSCPMNEIRIAYHGITKDYVPESLRSVAKPYSLAKDNKSQFEKILKEEGNRCSFNPSASFDDIFSCFFLNLPKIFSILKHNIMTSFLDLDIDWQGINEISMKDIKKAEQYLGEVVQKTDDYYCQKLVNLWFHLTGGINLRNNDTQPSLNKDQLPYKKSILDLIHELPDEIRKDVEKGWRSLLEHVGLKIQDSNSSYNINNIIRYDDSDIIAYLEKLDGMIQSKSKRQLKRFRGELEIIGNGETKIIYFNFHEWYLKLGDLLERLKSFLE